MRVFVTQPITESALARLRQVGEVEVHPDASKPIEKAALMAGVRGADILYCLLHDRVDGEVIAASPRLRLIASMAITPAGIAVVEATARGIPVTVIPPIVGEATADICFGLILAVARRMVEGDRLLRQGIFPGSQSSFLAGAGVCGKVLGLIGGGGRIGRAVARRAGGFAMPVLYWGPRRMPESDEREFAMTYVEFDEVFKQSDFVSIHAPLREDTRHLVGARELALMKRSAFLINTARGAVVDEAALIRALAERRIAGAGLDVFEREPFVDPELLAMDNVVLTPHLGSAVVELREQMANIVADNILAFLAGRRPPDCFNPEVYATENRRQTTEGG
jgi:glyoxylate reductase